MKVIFLLIITLLVLIIFYQEYRYRKVSHDIGKISNEVKIYTDKEQCKTLLYGTENKKVQKLLTEINILINLNRREKTLRVYNETSIRRMLSNVSHDIKTPLTIILGYIEILEQDNTLSKSEEEALIKKINFRAKEVLDLINKFFSLAKLESDDNHYELEKVDLGEISKQVLLSYYDILTNEDFEVEINMPHKNIYALGNKEALERIISNLINNAYKHGKEGKYIGINVKEDGDMISIEVMDKGVGISKRELSKIFERSYIGDNSRNKEISGSGLGLAITKKLVEIMKGSIEVSSETYVNTSFVVKLNKLDD